MHVVYPSSIPGAPQGPPTRSKPWELPRMAPKQNKTKQGTIQETNTQMAKLLEPADSQRASKVAHNQEQSYSTVEMAFVLRAADPS